MDGGKGRFIPIEATHPAVETRRTGLNGVFSRGDEIEIRGSRFLVLEIWPQRLILKLLPRESPTPPTET